MEISFLNVISRITFIITEPPEQAAQQLAFVMRNTYVILFNDHAHDLKVFYLLLEIHHHDRDHHPILSANVMNY